MADAPKTHNDKVYEHFAEVMRNTKAQLKELQPAPHGFRKRTDGEKQKIVDTLSTLPKDLSNLVLNQMAERAGHVDGENRPCELCGFIADMIAKKVK